MGAESYISATQGGSINTVNAAALITHLDEHRHRHELALAEAGDKLTRYIELLEALPPKPGAWATQAACKDQPDAFLGDHRGRGQTDQALAICAACPVIIPCDDYAAQHARGGVWAGQTRR